MKSFRKFHLDTISNYAILICRLALSLVIVPIYLHAFGEDLYGIYLLSFGFVGVLSFLDLGAGRALLRYTSEYSKDKNAQKYSEAISHSISLYAIGSSLIVLIFIAISFFALSLFNIPLQYEKQTFILFLLAALNAIVFFMQQIPNYILQGASVFLKRNIIQLINIALTIFLVIALVVFKFDIIIFSILTLINNIISLTIDLLLVKKTQILTAIKVKPILNKSLFTSTYFTYSKTAFFTSSLAVLSQQADKAIISSVMSVKYVTIYVIVTKPFFVLKSLLINIYVVLKPLLIKSSVGNTQNVFKKMVVDFIALTTCLIFPCVCLVNIHLKDFFRIWLHTHAYDTYVLWGIVAISNLSLTLFSSVFVRQMSLSDNNKLLLQVEFIGTLFNFFISIVLTYFMGIGGVIVGTTAQFMLVIFMIYRKTKVLYGISPREIFSNSMISFISLILCLTLVLYYVCSFILPGNTLLNLLRNIAVSVLIFMPIQYLYLKKWKLIKYLK